MTKRTSGLLIPAGQAECQSAHKPEESVLSSDIVCRARAFDAHSSGESLTHAKCDGGHNDLHAVVCPVCLHLLSLRLCHGCMVVAAPACIPLSPHGRSLNSS